jgi:hypothetical protein
MFMFDYFASPLLLPPPSCSAPVLALATAAADIFVALVFLGVVIN